MEEDLEDLIDDIFDEFASEGLFGLEMDRNEFFLAAKALLKRVKDL
jgi:hypothetical protein